MKSIAVGGGTYWELCIHPEWQAFYGSAGRAAALLAELGEHVELVTFTNDEKDRFLTRLAKRYGFVLGDGAIGPSVTFSYTNPISSPAISPPRHLLNQNNTVVAAAPIVLRFGALEGTVIAKGDRVVFDPQDTDLPERFASNGSTAGELAIVCNLREGRSLTERESPDDVARELLRRERACVAVVKLGASGAVVAESGHISSVPAYRTDSVFSIGSGDVFSAAFTFFWGRQRRSAHDAALLASQFVACYCDNKDELPASEQEVVEAVRTFKPSNVDSTIETDKPLIYLAGPFFTMSQIWLVDEAKAALEEQGFNVFSPYHEVGLGAAMEVAPKDLAALEAANLVYAIVDGLDAGTLFEIGYAIKRRIPVVAYTENESPASLTMLVGTGVHVVQDFATSIYKTSWIARP
jgi:nucleoside 2-deoxyribosyltransferase